VKRKLNTAARRLAEAKRLSVVFHRLQWELFELIQANADGWYDDDRVNRAMSEAEEMLQAFTGRLIATEGRRYQEWMDWADAGGIDRAARKTARQVEKKGRPRSKHQ
jgi:hypothetical protein